jgi:energy-coupling factor transport system permease protein
MSSLAPSAGPRTDAGWRTRDVVVSAVLGAAFGVVFWAWGNLVWPALAFLGPLQNLLYGPWLIPAVLAPLVIRRPGSGVFAEVVAASVSAILGSQWGVIVILYGVVQGLAGELPFLATRYRVFTWPVVVAAGVLASLAAWLLDWAFYYAAVDVATQLLVGALMVVSGIVIVAGGSLFLARALRDAGVLEAGGIEAGDIDAADRSADDRRGGPPT